MARLWLVMLPWVPGTWGARGGDELQGMLDAGSDIILEPGEVIELEEALKLRWRGQAIYTRGAVAVSDYGVIRHKPGKAGMLIDAYGIGGVRLHDLILDANRMEFGEPEGVLVQEPMISLGGAGATGQEIRRCIVMNSRSAGGWGAIHIQEGGDGIVVEDNVVFASGADIRGNGRSPYEKPFGWGDGISTASRNTLIRNNLVYDATDEGIMVQGGPGSIVGGNVIASISREMLGGIALIDPFGYYKMDTPDGKRFDYRGVVVEDNWIIAIGSRIHAGLPMGGAAWHPNLGGTVLVGATVRNNTISGEAGGYGYVANGIDGFTVTGNHSDAVYSGQGDGLPGRLPDPPSAFLFERGAVGGSQLQAEFKPAIEHVTKVLRSDRGRGVPVDALGYRDAGYTALEAEAIVETAWLEMLGRSPSSAEWAHWAGWLSGTHANADSLRRCLMTSREFIERFGYVNPLELHGWRSSRWLELISSSVGSSRTPDGQWPEARALHLKLIQTLERDR